MSPLPRPIVGTVQTYHTSFVHTIPNARNITSPFTTAHTISFHPENLTVNNKEMCECLCWCWLPNGCQAHISSGPTSRPPQRICIFPTHRRRTAHLHCNKMSALGPHKCHKVNIYTCTTSSSCERGFCGQPFGIIGEPNIGHDKSIQIIDQLHLRQTIL